MNGCALPLGRTRRPRRDLKGNALTMRDGAGLCWDKENAAPSKAKVFVAALDAGTGAPGGAGQRGLGGTRPDPFDPACPLSDEERRRLLAQHNRWVKSMATLDEETRRKLQERVGRGGLSCWDDG